MQSLQYISLHVLLLVVLIFFSYKISKKANAKNYWKYALIPIVVFGLEEGLRWGRETDWNLYYSVYQSYISGKWTNHEPLFQLLWKTFAIFAIPYPGVITACSTFFAYAVFYFFKEHKNIIWVAIPLTFACHLITASNLIRWYMAISFCLISVCHFDKKKNIQGLLFAFAGFLCHYGIILFWGIYAICKKNKCIAKPVWAIPICIFLIIFFDKSILSHFGFIYDLFKHVDRFSGYFDNGYGLITGEGVDVQQKGLLSAFFSFIPYIAFILYGYRLKVGNIIPPSLYNIVVLASFFKIISSGLEFFGRYYYLLDFFICMTAAYVVNYMLHIQKNTIGKILFLFCIMYVIRKFIYMCQPYAHDELMLYIWNNQIDPKDLYYLRRTLQ